MLLFCSAEGKGISEGSEMAGRGGGRIGSGRKLGSISTVNGFCRKFPDLKVELQVATLRLAQAGEQRQRAAVDEIIAALRKASDGTAVVEHGVVERVPA